MARSWQPAVFLMTLLVIMGVIQSSRAVFQAEITLGDIFAIATPIVLASAFFIATQVRKRRPFTFKFAGQRFDITPQERRHRTYSRKKYLALGESTLTIAVRTRIETIANPFDVRFVQRSLIPWKWRDADKNDINIVKVSVPDWKREAELERDYVGPNDVHISANGMGGFIVTTRLPKRWVSGRVLWIELTVTAKRSWCGHLTFEGGTDKLAYARRPVIVWSELI